MSASSGGGSTNGFSFHDDFRFVTEDHPCPICGRTRGCAIHKSGRSVLCYHVPSDIICGNAGWKHWLSEVVTDLPPITEAAEKLNPAAVKDRVMEFIDAINPPRLYDLANSLGVRWEGLERLDVGWNTAVECYTFPMRNAEGQYVGVRYRFPDGTKRSLKGGREGLFVPSATLGGRMLFVTEGPTDAAALLDCAFMAIGRPNCTGGIDEVVAVVEKHKPGDVVIVSDPDACGQDGAARLAKALGGLAHVVTIRPTSAKDARACVLRGGRRDSIIEALTTGSNEHWTLVPAKG